LRADRVIVRTQSVIRADGPPAAPVLALHFEAADFAERPLRALRANPVFPIRMKSVSVSKKQGYE
jgi:hypothetical protein